MTYSAAILSKASGLVVVGVFQDEKWVGEYKCDSASVDGTFLAFTNPLNGKDYALYSPNMMLTRVMELPSCLDIGGEEVGEHNFYPTEYYIPFDEETGLFLPCGFVAGYDDGAQVRLQFLDLSQVHRGIIVREERFGKIAIPDDLYLENVVSVNDDIVSISVLKEFDLATGVELE